MTLNTSTALRESIDLVRQQFPALDRPVILPDNAARTQYPGKALRASTAI